MKLSGAFLLLFLASLPGLVAQEVASTEESLSREIDVNWKALQIRAKDLSPEDRIAAVGQWQQAQQPKLEALKQEKIQSARQVQNVPISLPSPPLVTELDQINAAIEKEFQPIRSAKLSPEERIRQVDAAMEKTSSMQEQREGILREAATSANTAVPLITNPISSDQNTPENRLADKSREMLEQTKNMAPEARIAAIDARQDEIEALTREVQAAQKAAAISNQQKSPN
jgi:hypothetical protein